MNHLAHVLVAGADEDMILGSWLGDFVHGNIDPDLRAGVRSGLALHRAVDVFTDRHPIVVSARNVFQPPYRRYAGIILDIWFDHLLARDFRRWSRQPLEIYSQEARELLHRRSNLLPAALRRFLAYMQVHDLPFAYRDESQIERVFAGVGSRLSRANPLASSIAEIERLRPELQAAFDAFFPDLIAFGEQFRNRCKQAARDQDRIA
ncbi:MAG: ACP phosphodiesterase [Dokdonella sp.]